MRWFYSTLTCVLLLAGSGHIFAQNRAVSLHLSSNNDRNYLGDIITKTIFVPEGFTPNYTYYSAMGWWGTGGEGDGYCGIQQHPAGRNYIFSLWDPEASTEAITAAYQGHGTMVERFGGEGTGLKSWNFALGWETDTWYRMVNRLWNYAGHTYFGYWVQNTSTGEWYHLITMDYPVPGVRINTGINSFLEDWYGNGWEKRRYHIKDGYKRSPAGDWIPFTRCIFSVNQEAATSNYNNNYDGGTVDGEYYYMQSGGDTEPTCLTQAVFTLEEEPLPDWDTIVIQHSAVTYDAVERKLMLDWEVDPTAGPQLAWYGAIYDNAEGNGTPVMVFGDTIPQQREVELDLAELSDGTWYLHFSLRDIFDGVSETAVQVFEADTEVKKPVAVFSTESDSVYQYSFVQFRESSGGVPSAWQWSFEGGNPGSSIERHPMVAYNDTGRFDVQFVASNSLGSDTLVEEDYMTVLSTGDMALDLRGTMGDFVEIPALNLSGNEFSFECWLKIEEDQDPYTGIFFYRNGKACGLNFRTNNELGYHWNDRFWSWSTGLTVPIGRWCHVALVVEAEKAVLFLDGMPAINQTSHEKVDFSGPSSLGADYPVERNYNGLIDQVRIWDVALSPAKVLDRRYMDLDPDTEEDLLASYRCNQRETKGLFDLREQRHGKFVSLDSESWVPSFEKINVERAPQAAFAASTSETEVNTPVQFYDASAFVPTSWHWYFKGGNPAESHERFPELSFPEPGTYDVKLVVWNSQGSDSVETAAVITVVNPPPPVAIFAANRVKISKGESISMNNMSKNNPDSYLWTFEGGDPESSTEEEPVVTYAECGKFDIRLEVSNPYGSDTLELKDYITVTPPVGINSHEAPVQVQVLNGLVMLHLEEAPQARVSIYSMTGTMLHSTVLEQGSSSLQPELPSGIYLLRVRAGKHLITEKIYL